MIKILYGIQGTGNGHITRARMMAKYFSKSNVDITYLFSGREQNLLFDMECFGDYQHRKGLTFVTQAGSVCYGRTALHNNMPRFIRDVMTLDLDPYDVILTDFEPVTAWAGKLNGKEVIGVGHQYAFGSNVPKAGANFVANAVMRHFAPVSLGIGYHWHHFGHDNILPPIIDHNLTATSSGDFILVYLPFEHQHTVTALLNCLGKFKFIQYSPELTDSTKANVTLRKTCHDGFKRDLSRCRGVICNAGFELISECLSMQLPLLVKPVQGQMEQLSNAAALQKLGYACTIDQLNLDAVANWLDNDKQVPSLSFPNVAKAIVDWLQCHQREDIRQLAARLWLQQGLSATAAPLTPV